MLSMWACNHWQEPSREHCAHVLMQPTCAQHPYQRCHYTRPVHCVSSSSCNKGTRALKQGIRPYAQRCGDVHVQLLLQAMLQGQHSESMTKHCPRQSLVAQRAMQNSAHSSACAQALHQLPHTKPQVTHCTAQHSAKPVAAAPSAS